MNDTAHDNWPQSYRAAGRMAELRRAFDPRTPERSQVLQDELRDLDSEWRPHAEDIAKRRFDGRPSKWHTSRADGLRQPLSHRVMPCGAKTMHTRCGCKAYAAPVACGQWRVCKACNLRRARKQRAKLRRAMDALSLHHNAGRPKSGGGELRWAFYTLTTRHTGDIQKDRAHIDRAWQRLRAWIQAKCGDSFPFVLVYEMTPGRDGLGHIHAHVCQLLPWLDFNELRQAWLRAAELEAGNFHIEQVQPRRAANYVTKYLTKGVAGLAPQLGARWLAVSYGKRNCRTSQGFYDLAGVAVSLDTRRRFVPCACCNQRYAMLGIVAVPFVPARNLALDRTPGVWPTRASWRPMH